MYPQVLATTQTATVNRYRYGTVLIKTFQIQFDCLILMGPSDPSIDVGMDLHWPCRSQKKWQSTNYYSWFEMAQFA